MGEDEDDKREKDIDKLEGVHRNLADLDRKPHIPYNFGQCNKCNKFIFTEYEGYGNFKAYCQLNYGQLLPRTLALRVTNCNNFWDKSHLTIRELAEMAYWLDVKADIGFRGN
jgi:hypothetical protein